MAHLETAFLRSNDATYKFEYSKIEDDQQILREHCIKKLRSEVSE